MLTTCAEDFVTWDDVYEPGDEHINGVRVERHRSSRRPPARRSTRCPPRCWPIRSRRRSRMPNVGSTCRDRWRRTWPPRPRPGTAMRWSSTPICTGRRSGSSTGWRADHPPSGGPRRARPPPADLPAQCSRRPMPWCSRPRPSDTWSNGSSRWPVTTSCSSDWASTIRTTGPDLPRWCPTTARHPGPGRPICCASGGSTSTREPRCSPPTSPGTSSASPVPCAWSWPARSSRHRRPIRKSTWWVRCPRGRSGICSPARRHW